MLRNPILIATITDFIGFVNRNLFNKRSVVSIQIVQLDHVVVPPPVVIVRTPTNRSFFYILIEVSLITPVKSTRSFVALEEFLG